MSPRVTGVTGFVTRTSSIGAGCHGVTLSQPSPNVRVCVREGGTGVRVCVFSLESLVTA